MSDMVFSKEAFLASDSGNRLRHLVGAHLSILDGLSVQYATDGFGIIRYEVDGEEWELYPVMPEWCVEQSQISLFGGT